jgi:hypothetical protein
MGTAHVLPPAWGEVIEQMRVGVGSRLAAIKEQPESVPLSVLPSLRRSLPALDGLEAAVGRAEACAAEGEQAFQAVADDLARWSAASAQAARTLAERLQRAVG